MLAAGGTGGDVNLQAQGNISTTGAINLDGGSFTADSPSSLTFNGIVSSNGTTNLNIGSNVTPINITFGNGILTQGGSITVNTMGN